MNYLRLLDCFALTCDGRSISVPGSAQRLLAYLALHSYPLRRAHASLRSALWRVQ